MSTVVAHKLKRAELIFNPDFMSIPLNFDIVETIFEKVSAKRIAFHVLNIKFLKVLVSKQNTNLSLSCSRNKVIDPLLWEGPMDYYRDANKNIVVKLKGFINYGHNLDMWTAPDEYGNRWITDMIAGSPELSSGMQIVSDSLLEYKQLVFSHMGNYYGYTKLPRKERLHMEQQFMDEAKKLFIKHKDVLVKDLGKMLSKQSVKYDAGEENYDEFVVSNYKIHSVAIPKKSTMNKKVVTENLKKRYGISVVEYGSSFFNLKNDGQ